MNPDPLFTTSVIGSMPRPAFVQDLISDGSDYSQEEYDAWLQGKYDANATPADWGWSWEEGV